MTRAYPPPNKGRARPVERGELFQVVPIDPDTQLPKTPLAGVFLIVSPDTYARNSAALAAFLYNPPLYRVWAGDDPVDPFLTALLRFPTQAAADAVLAALV